jgi:hypothetical protein
LPKFHAIELNALRLPDSNESYSKICEALTGKRFAPKVAAELLDKIVFKASHQKFSW